MTFNAMTDIAIGLVALFWIVATAASFGVEFISSIFNIRGKALELYVREMVFGVDMMQGARRSLRWLQRASPAERPGAASSAANARALDITDHPLIRRLGKPAVRISVGDTPPSYIPAGLFSMALVDRLREAHAGALVVCDGVRAARAALPQPLPPALDSALGRATTALDALGATRHLLEALAQTAGTPAPDPQAALEAIAQAASGPARSFWLATADAMRTPGAWSAIPTTLPELAAAVQLAAAGRTLTVADLQSIVASGKLPAPLQSSLRPLLDAANHDMQDFLKGIEGWYDSVMDRTTGWFRRYTQVLLLVVAFSISAALNLDTIAIVKHLARDHEARAAAVKLGEGIVAQGDLAANLVPTAAFYRRFASAKWEAALNAGAASLKDANSLAQQVQPLLLTRGGLFGPMMELQAAALQIEARCRDEQADCAKDAIQKRWAEHHKALVALSAAACRATRDQASVTESQRAWIAQQGDDALANADTPELPPLCRTLAQNVNVSARGPVATMTSLWSNPSIVWETDLAVAAWTVRQLAAKEGSDQTEQVLSNFKTRMGNAIDHAQAKLQALDDVLSHLPEVGVGKLKLVLFAPGACLGTWLQSAAGLLITAFMAALGAPLWFDLLGKLTNRRITGPKPEVSSAAEAT